VVTPRNAQRIKVPSGYRRALLDRFRGRAAQVADILRALLFALCTGAIYFIIDKNYIHLGWHLLPLASFGLAIATLVWSWELQKRKALERVNKLRDEDYKAYREYEKQVAGTWYLKNANIDYRICYGLITLGALTEVAILFRSD
jgi:hypothetical protein